MTAVSWPVDLELKQFFGVNVRHHRERAHLTQLELATAIGMGQTTISQMETGRQFATWSTLRALADVLGVGLGDLVGTAPRQRQRKKAA